MTDRLSEQEVFAEALKRSDPGERAAFLHRTCRENLLLRQRVEALLRASEDAGDFLEHPPAELREDPQLGEVTAALAEKGGDWIGRYKLLQQIGEGGCGVVYMAEQEQPIRRRVALKIIKLGMDTKSVIARFEAERQALALMDHPNIAKVLDAGATESGRPYFVMELVRGVRITDYCDENNLSTHERLLLFIKVCQAIQHAHQKGIIHRDIKPSNILITINDGVAVPKVIDFGIAKATNQQRLTDKTVFTAFDRFIGTPAYMSPEQVAMTSVDVDTRSDIYSLGVLLYELLTGRTPFDPKQLWKIGLDEVRRTIWEQEPLRPSNLLSTLAESERTTTSRRRRTEPARLIHLLQRDLDWIVMKALDKDRNRRYETANGLAIDLQRHLNGEPVVARPPSTLYQLNKFARRHRSMVATAGVLLLALLLVLGSVGWIVRDQALRRIAVEQQVSRSLEDAEEFLREDRLSEALATVQQARVLFAASSQVETATRADLKQLQTDLEMALRLESIGLKHAGVREECYECFDPDAANAEYHEAFRDYGIDLLTEGTHAAERIKRSRVASYMVAAIDDWALSLQEHGVAEFTNLLGLARLADSDRWRGQVRDAFALARLGDLEALALDLSITNKPPSSVRLLATALRSVNRTPVALAVLRQCLVDHPEDYWSNLRVAVFLYREAFAGANDNKPDSTRLDEALGYCRAALALRPQSAEVHGLLGGLLSSQGKLREAEVELRKAIHLRPDYHRAYHVLGTVLIRQGKLAESEAILREACRQRPNEAIVHNDLGLALRRMGRQEEAAVEYFEAIRLRPEYAEAHADLGIVLSAQGKLDEAEDVLRQATRLTFKKREKECVPLIALGSVLQRKGKLAEAEKTLCEAIQNNPTTVLAYVRLGELLLDQNRVAEGIAAYEQAVRNSHDDAMWLNNVAWGLGKLRKADPSVFAKALALAEKAVRLAPQGGEYWNTLSLVEYRNGHWNASIAAAQKSIQYRGENAYDALFLAMAYWQLKQKIEARNHYDHAVDMMSKQSPVQPELSELHAEARKLMRLDSGDSSKAEGPTQ